MSMSFAHDGRVLAHNYNGTGTVCGEMWDDNDAGVLCRQMGFASGSAILLPRDPVFNRFYFNVNCFGNETDVQSCHASTYDISGMCGYFEDAGVVCNGMPSGKTQHKNAFALQHVRNDNCKWHFSPPPFYCYWAVGGH